jgi:hypothetical protein
MSKPLERAVVEYEREKRILKGVAQSTFQVVSVELLMEILATLRRIEKNQRKP